MTKILSYYNIMSHNNSISDILDDITKYFTFILTIHFLESLSNDNIVFLNDTFLRKLLFLLIGIIIYHSIIKKIKIKKLFE